MRQRSPIPIILILAALAVVSGASICMAGPATPDGTKHLIRVPIADATKHLITVPFADAPEHTKRAIVIGIDNYENVTPLTVCANDAHAFANLLQTKFGFSSVTLMTDEPGTPERLQPRYLNIKHQLTALLQGIVPGQTQVVLFYSGHGTRHAGSAGTDADYIAPLDCDSADISGTCVNYTAFKAGLEAAQPARALLVMDACRDFTPGKGMEVNDFGSIKIPMGPQIAELLSCQPKQVSREGLHKDFSQSVFTHFLINGLEGAPDAVDVDKHAVTFDSLKLYVQAEVSDYVSRNFNGAAQVPDGDAKFGSMVLALYNPEITAHTGQVLPPDPAPQRTYSAAASASLVSLWAPNGTIINKLAGNVTVAAVQHELDAGADPDARNSDYYETTLSYAAHNGLYDVVQLLIDHGAQIDTTNKGDDTPLIEAASCNEVPAAQLLISRGAKIDFQNRLGKTALMATAAFCRPDVLQFLLNKGAAVNTKDVFGRTALYYAEHPSPFYGQMPSQQDQADSITVLKKAGGTE